MPVPTARRLSASQSSGYPHREKLEPSAAADAELVGAAELTIYNWEHGRTRPRAQQLAQWAKVRGIGKREAWRRLGY